MSPVVGMVLSLIAGSFVAYLLFSTGEVMFEQNASIRAQVFPNIVQLSVTLLSVISAGLIVIGIGFSYMMNKSNHDINDTNPK